MKLTSDVKSIFKNVKDISCEKKVHQTKTDLISCRQYISSILSKILKCTSPTFPEDSPAMILIGIIVTNIIANRYTPLQIALAILIQQKSLIKHL